MNKTFKTIWNDARRCFIVANETQKSHGKPSKSAVALAVAATALFSTVASAAYIEKGFVAQNSEQVAEAQKSWQSDEYKKDWGLEAMHASKAYALGYNGQGVAIGMMDSGALLQKHPELSGDRWHASHASGSYGSSGNRYQIGAEGVGDVFGNGEYQKGEKFDIDGNFIANRNDTHGTHVIGTIGANRDGSEFHGVAFGSDIWAGNTGGTDNTNYGPFQDYNFFYAGWKALADNINASNGVDRGGVINNSFGTNLRVNDKGDSLATNTTAQTEYEYFLFKKKYGDEKSFVDAAYDAVKGTNVVQIFTTGNRDMKMPYYRPLYPYFNPEAENNWIAVAGLEKAWDWKKVNGEWEQVYQTDKNGQPIYRWIDYFNEAGNAKWWTVVAPGESIYSSIVYDDHYCPSDEKHPLGSAGYKALGGTSMAAPHVAGAMGVLMSRYQDMNAIQVRDIMFTTANHTNPDGTPMPGWTAAEGTPDVLYGWGAPDLDKGMYGPGQFLGKFDYNMATTKLDVWSNDISNVALDARKAEDQAWMTATKDGTDLSAELELGVGNKIPSIDDATISKADAEKWRAEYYAKRAQAIKDKLANGAYEGSLVKRGQGTLIMTGNNTYRGGTTVEEGTLLGYKGSFGVSGNDAKAIANGKVTVNGGIFGVMNAYNDQFTMKGDIADKSDHSVDITVNAGGTYGVVAGQDVEVGNLTFQEGAGVTVVSTDSDVLVDAYNSKDGVTGSVTASKLEGAELAVANPDYAFFDTDIKVEGNKLSSTLTRSDASVATYANSASGASIATALESNTDSKLFADMVSSTKEQVSNTLDSLGSDLHMAVNNSTIVNTTSLARTIKDQANAYGQARTAELASGAQIWATGIGNWSKVDAGGASVDMDVDYYVGLVGGEVAYGNNNKVGVFFGAGTTDSDASADGKVESNDIHFGVYGENAWDALGVTYGFTYTNQDRDAKRSLLVKDQVGFNSVNYDAEVMQVFGEVSYKGFNSDAFTVEPYAGLSYMKISADSFTEKVGTHEFKTQLDDQKVGTVNVGVRGAMPFSVAGLNMAVKGDVGYMQFFGDKESTAKMTLGDAGTANLKGEELSGMGAVGLGVDAAIGKNTTIGISYTGALGSDITSHGVGATLRVKF